MKLYELTGEYRALEAAIDAGEIPEDAIADTLEGLTGEVDEKIDSIISLIKEKRSFTEAIAKEVAELQKRQKSAEKKAEWLEGYISRALEAMGRDKFESPRHKVTFRRSTALRITDEAALIEWARKYAPDAVKVKESVSKDAITKLTESVNVPHVALEVRHNMQIK